MISQLLQTQILAGVFIVVSVLIFLILLKLRRELNDTKVKEGEK